MPGMASAPDELADARVDELTIERATDEAALAEAARRGDGFGTPVERSNRCTRAPSCRWTGSRCTSAVSPARL